MKARGEFGYTRALKKSLIIKVCVIIVVALAIFLVGFFLNDHSNKNVFTIVAILLVLPGARFLTRLLIIIPYKEISKEEYDKVDLLCKGNYKLMSALVMTSEQKVMYMDYMYIGNGAVIGLYVKDKGSFWGKRAGDTSLSDKKGVSFVQAYISKGVRNYADKYRVLITDNPKKFEDEIKKIAAREVKKEEEEKVLAYLSSLIV